MFEAIRTALFRFFIRAYGRSWLPDSVCRWCIRRLTGFNDADELS